MGDGSNGKGMGIAVIAVILLASIALFSLGLYISSRPATVQGEMAPEISLTDVDGKRFDLSELRGRIVLVCFINDMCSYSYSRDQMRELKNATNEIGWDRLVPVTMNARIVDEEQFRRFRDSNECNWTFAVGTMEVISSYGADAEKALPMVLLVDRDGRIAYRNQGSVTGSSDIVSAFRSLEEARSRALYDRMVNA
ncbi:MAG: redoxin domain-containing protein [Candidatus Thermoplasmatota archaeon]|nr:redoxin domain-containing protein [Candidatus Thermoplasmatota archaeon]